MYLVKRKHVLFNYFVVDEPDPGDIVVCSIKAITDEFDKGGDNNTKDIVKRLNIPLRTSHTVSKIISRHIVQMISKSQAGKHCN
jgi:hypothetical protein